MARPDKTTRAALLLRTTLGGVALGGVALWAQAASALPSAAPTMVVNTGGGNPVITNAGAVQTIKLNAPRTVLQYNGFAIAGGETVDFRFDNRQDLAVVHSTTSAIQVDGTLNSFVGAGSTVGGNVWLLSAAGVFFGPGARVDVGGLLASTAIPSDLTSPTGAVLTPGTLSFNFDTGNNGAVTVAAGAVITGHGGTLAFIAPSVTTGKNANGTAVIGGASNTSVLYGAAQRYTVQFVQEAGNDLDLLSFEVPGLTAGSTAAMPLQLAGTTTAGNVYIASVSRADTVNAVLSAPGNITATSAGVDGGTIVLTAGGGIVNHAAGALLPAGAFAHNIVAAGTIDGAKDVTVTGTGNIVATSLAAGRDLSIIAANGLAHVGAAHVGQDFLLSGKTVELGSLSGYQAPGSGNGYGYGYGVLTPTRDITILASAGGFTFGKSLTATRDLTIDVTGALSVTSANTVIGLTAGDDIRLHGGTVTVDGLRTTGDGSDIDADGSNIVATGGAVRVYEADSANDIRVDSTGNVNFGTGFSAVAAHDLIIKGTNIDYGSLEAGNDLSLTATAGSVQAAGLGLNGLSAGRDLLIDVSGDLVAGPLETVRDLTLIGATITADSAIAGRNVDATARTGALSITDVKAGNDIRLRGVTVFAETVETTAIDADAADGGNIIISGGAVEVYEADAAHDIRADSTGLVKFGTGFSAVAANDITIRGTAIDFGALDAGRDLKLTATDGTIQAVGFATGELSAGRDVSIDVSGDLVADSLQAVRDLTLIGANISASFASGGRDVTVTARTGTLDIGDISAGDDVQLSGPTITVGSVSAYGDATGSEAFGPADSESDGANVVATGGTITLGRVYAGTDINVVGTGVVTIGIVQDQGGEGGDFAKVIPVGGYADAGQDILLTGSSVVTGPLDAGRDAVITATAGDALIESANVKRDLTVLAALGLASVGDARVGGNLLMSGESVFLGSLDGYTTDDGYGGYGYGGYGYGGYGYGGNGYGGIFTLTQNATLTATAGDVFGGASLFVANDVLVSATGDVALGNIGAGTGVIATAGGELALGDIAGGRDVRLQGGTLATGGIDAGRDLSLTATASGITVGDLTAVRDLTLDASGDLNAGNVGAGRDLVLAGANVTAINASAVGDVTATARTGTLTLATVTAGDDVRLAGVTQSLGQVEATGLGVDGEDDGFNIVLTGGAITASQLAAATDIDVTGTGAVQLGQATAGQDVRVTGGTVGGSLQLSGRDVSVTSGGAFAATAGLNATRDLHLTAGTTLSYTTLLAARDLFLTAATVSGGSATATRDLTVMATLGITGDLFQAGRNLVLDPNQPIVAGTVIAGANATLIGSSVTVGTLTVGGTTFAQATAGGIGLDTFKGTGDTVLIATGKIVLGDATTAGLRIVGGDLDVRRSLVASTLAVETPGNMIIGGTAGENETGFRLAAADMARLRVSGIANFYAGVTSADNDGNVAGGNLTIQDFGYDPANLPRLAFFADRSHVVDIQGHVLPTTNGGAVQIGDSNINGRFRPDSIFISGSFGSAELVANCFGNIVALGSLSMFAVNDVIFGASDFRAVIRSTAAGNIDLGAGNPSVPAGPGDDRLFAVAARFTVDAGGKIVSQNTASNQGGFAGLLFTGLGAPGQVVSVGNARAIDLAGSLIDANGFLRSGLTAANADELGPGGTNGAIFRFNSCVVGGGDCTGAPGTNPSEALRLETYDVARPIDITDGPLTTVLIIDQQLDGLDILTVGTDDNAIIIKKKPGQQ